MSEMVRTLRNGVHIPWLGFGTDRTFVFIRKNVIAGGIELVKDLTIGGRYHIKRDISLAKVVRSAPSIGCNLFDTASSYGQSERVLGHALKDFKRDEYFIITKLSNEEQRIGDVRLALKKSMKRLGLETLDLYLMHWPQTNTYLKCWKEMEMLYDEGLVRAIGVCNFKMHHFEEIEKTAEIMPMVCQIESHPLFQQNEMLSFCKNNNIQMMAYTPTGRMDRRIITNGVMVNIADIHNKTIPQIIMRWHYQRGVIPIVNTTNINHLMSNLDIFNFSLSEEEMHAIESVDINCRLRYDPDTVDFTKC